MNVSAAGVRPRRWTRQEYERMVEVGVFGPEDHVELVQGEILVMSPEKSRHAATIDLVAEALRSVFGPGFHIRVQHPLAVGVDSQPEPDLAVVSGSPREYVDSHPDTALLLVEVAETSLAYDRSTKAALYAQAGIEYWIVNLQDGCVEVHREPRDDHYQAITVHRSPDEIAPLAASAEQIPVADLLP